MLSCLLHSGRLVARTPAFQVGEAGSKPVRSTSQLGAVVGYGFALQAYCLEGFDTLGLHQFYLYEALSGCVHGLGPCGLGSNPSMETIFALVSLVVEVLFCNQGVEVRFLPGAPSLGCEQQI